MAKEITKKQQIINVVNELFKSKSALETSEIKAACKDIAVDRTVLRALAAMKAAGEIVKEGDIWTSLIIESIPEEMPEDKKDDTQAPENKDDNVISLFDADKKDDSKDDITIPEENDDAQDAKLDPEDAKFFGFNNNGNFLGAYLTKKEALDDLKEYSAETGNATLLLEKSQLSPDQCKRIGIDYVAPEAIPHRKKKDKGPATPEEKPENMPETTEKIKEKTKGTQKPIDDQKVDKKAKKSIKADELIKAAKDAKNYGNTIQRNPHPVSKKKLVDQSEIIREGIRANKSIDEISTYLAKTMTDAGITGKDFKWAKARLKSYQKAYGKKGEADKKL